MDATLPEPTSTHTTARTVHPGTRSDMLAILETSKSMQMALLLWIFGMISSVYPEMVITALLGKFFSQHPSLFGVCAGLPFIHSFIPSFPIDFFV